MPTKHLDLLVIDCGRHGNDADGVAAFAAMVAEHGALPDHPIVTTPNKGEHHFFRQPADFKIGNKPFAPGIDTRGYKPDNHGGYVIAPGSELPNGRRWKPYKGALSIKSLPQTDTPIWQADMLREKEAPKPPAVVPTLPPTNREEKWAQGALDNIAREIAVTGEGDRNSALNRAAFRMGTMVARGWIGRGDCHRQALRCCRRWDASKSIKDERDVRQKPPEMLDWAAVHRGLHYDQKLQPHLVNLRRIPCIIFAELCARGLTSNPKCILHTARWRTRQGLQYT